jgi:hypothetical protein
VAADESALIDSNSVPDVRNEYFLKDTREVVLHQEMQEAKCSDTADQELQQTPGSNISELRSRTVLFSASSTEMGRNGTIQTLHPTAERAIER